jgi:hypothetical protein
MACCGHARTLVPAYASGSEGPLKVLQTRHRKATGTLDSDYRGDPLRLSGSGWGAVRRSERFITSDRQLPPGHNPGADCGEASNGRQRGSRPLDILVEYDKPWSEKCPGQDDHSDHVGFAPDEPVPPKQASRAGRVTTITAVTAITALMAGPRWQRSRQSQCQRWARARRASVTNRTSHDVHSRHGGHGGAARRSRRSRETCPPWPPCGRPDGAGHNDSCDHGDHSDHGGHGGHIAIMERMRLARRITATTSVLAIAEAPCGARTPHSDHGSGPPSGRNRLRPAGGAPTRPPGRAGGQKS